jgi:hypothetical protein
MMLHACLTTRLRLLRTQTRQVSSSSVKTSFRSPGRLGIRLSRESFPLGVPRFMAIGTAVRAPDAAHGPPVPFTCRLSRQDLRQVDNGGLRTRRTCARYLDRVAARRPAECSSATNRAARRAPALPPLGS